MGRKLTDAEWNDPDFQDLLAALKKISKPVGYLRSDPSAPLNIKAAPLGQNRSISDKTG